ncbi:hypothetical protein Cgig2_017205 [Carnegiea gigantea]|uniref:PROP1-like PPR domain-containing protein n=1 Tax=Carnegiea gigantea TaxID=171969 RepID=A0A9Q1KH96_9CARY|nr:hypothetical protein Cgig2_017205 [Carnegiea gigantea]
MWALRRASANSVRVHGLNLAAFRACAGLGTFGSHAEDKSSNPEQTTCALDGLLSSKRCYHAARIPSRFSAGSQTFSSRAGAKSGGEEEADLEEGFSELETHEVTETTGQGDIEDDSTSVSESELSDDESLEDALETELIEDLAMDSAKTESKKKRVLSDLCKLIMDEPGHSISDALDKYVADGKELSQSEIYDTLLNLRRRKMFGKALQLSEWADKKKVINFTEREYASRVDLIAKVQGLQKAENYIETIPKSYREEVVYRTLLANCVGATNVKKAEEVFNKMKDLDFPLTAFACNQLLLLYKRTDKKKIADVLLMMEKENVKPTRFTYQLLIDTKGQFRDIVGMDQIVETMKAEGIELNFRMRATLARHYAAAGLNEKAEAVLKEIEGDDLEAKHWKRAILLSLYADIGNADQVERVWKACESKPHNQESLAAIEAFGKLKNVAKAEAVFSKMSNAVKKLSPRYYTFMLKVYADNKMLNKGKEFLKQMGDSGCHIGPITWDAVVKLYVDAGEVEKADSILQKAAQQNSQRPLFTSYMLILDQYAKRGDIHNAEKIFHRMRQAGYVSRARPYHGLLQAYINAKAPAYGIRERMKADNIVPNKGLAAQLSLVDAFKKTSVSDLLD